MDKEKWLFSVALALHKDILYEKKELRQNTAATISNKILALYLGLK